MFPTGPVASSLTLSCYSINPVNVLIVVINSWYQARLFCSSEPAQTTPTQHVQPWTIQLCLSGNKPDRTSLYLSSPLFILLFHPLTCSHPETGACWWLIKDWRWRFNERRAKKQRERFIRWIRLRSGVRTGAHVLLTCVCVCVCVCGPVLMWIINNVCLVFSSN